MHDNYRAPSMGRRARVPSQKARMADDSLQAQQGKGAKSGTGVEDAVRNLGLRNPRVRILVVACKLKVEHGINGLLLLL